MVYITSDGVIGRRSPWSLSAIFEFFMGILNLIYLLIKTIFQPNLTRRGTGYTTNYRSGFSGQPPPSPPRRRMGGFGSGVDSSSAPMSGGGCCGGGCGT